VYYIFQSKKTVSERVYIGVPYGVQKFYSGSVVKITGKSPLKYTFAQKLSCLNPKGMTTESSEGNITAFRALVRHLNEANRVAEVDADFITLQEIPGGGSSSEQV